MCSVSDTSPNPSGFPVLLGGAAPDGIDITDPRWITMCRGSTKKNQKKDNLCSPRAGRARLNNYSKLVALHRLHTLGA
jgi:hypothetical protein